MSTADPTGDRRIRSVVIIGGGTAGWMAASAINRLVDPGRLKVTLVESAEIGTVGVGESTLPHFRAFNASIEVTEADFMRATGATFKLGIRFENWGAEGETYFHPFGVHGAGNEEAPFHHYWLKASRTADVGSIDDYSLPAVMARKERFTHPASEPGALGSSFTYGYQMDAGLYAAFLRGRAEAAGVTRVEGRVVKVDQDERGLIRSVTLERGETIEGDLFIDCSGFRGLLIEQTLRSGFADWSHWLPCDSAVAIPCALSRAGTPYTRATALKGGWQFRIPLQHRVGNGYVYSSEVMDRETAAAALIGRLEGDMLAEPNHLRFKAGQRTRNWIGNCVAVGLSAGFIEPLESTSIYLIQKAITTLIELWPDRMFDPVDSGEFNRTMDMEAERVRDFIILHYHATRRDDSPLWDHVRTMAPPDSLAEKIELFRSRGAVRLDREGLFMHPSWVAVLLGQGVTPERHHPLADKAPDARLIPGLAGLREAIRRAAAAMPAHDDALARSQG
ncbi:MAG: tryptophan 7-halogenase [Brevundimonas sp.]|uniref:tryptophan halogenase family protein n=1 Tax=Brevundimonas sp. TaxID=1871086 RepID=UPI002487EFC3|nr:tryptophan 7-halogenase [Brevundimonas sp.]MDI1328532.1 tryptophan 7-halogenase [Brevundimonas sp.]